MRYCLVENGAVVEGPRDLPVSWKNISGLNRASASELLDFGWYPVEGEEPAVDETTQKIGARRFVIGVDKVTLEWDIDLKTAQDKWENWKRDMSTSDEEDMSREMEDLIEGQHSGSVTNEKLQAKYDAKKVKRAAQPEKPPEPDLPE